MEIVHRVGIHADPGIVAEIRGLGVVPEVGPLIASFDASESAPNWRRVDAWIRRRRPSDIVSTRFDDAEIEAARWLEPAITQHRGFPQPRDGDFGYRELTFDVADYCTTCGIGLRQVSPFQMKGDPNWGRRGVLQMHWVYDVFFARPDVWRDVFEPFGIGKRSVMKPSGTVLESVVQVTVDETVPVDVEGLSPLALRPGEV